MDRLTVRADIHVEEARDFPKNKLVIPRGSLQKIIKEAESKWEAEVCEWKLTKGRVFFPYKAACGDNFFSDGDNYNYCPYCGKRIKIAEEQNE